MIIILSTVLYLFFLQSATSEDLNVVHDIVRSVLDHYRSHSVVFIFDESSTDLCTFLTLQKRLSFGKKFYFSSITTSSKFPESVRKSRQNLAEAVVVWNPDETFPNILEKVSATTDITSQKWFLTTSTLTPQSFDNVTIPLRTEFTIAYGNPYTGYTLEEVYDIRPGKKLRNSLGRWQGKREQLQPSLDIFKRRSDFRGAAIKVMSPKRDSCDGASFAVVVSSVVWCIHQNLWAMMEEMLNATTEVQVNPNLNVDTIRHSDVDLTFRSAHVNGVEMNTRDYLWPTFMVKVEVVTSYIKQQVEWGTYVLPFRQQMWMVILLWIIVWDVILAFVRYIILGKEKKKSFFGSYCEFSFTAAFALCSQGVLCPSRLSGIRIIFLMMFIVPAVLYPGYSAVLTSFLTVQQDKRPFQSLEELSRNKEYKLGWHKTFALEHMFNLENITPVTEALMRNNVLPQDELPATDAEGIERMCKEKFSYLTIKDTLLALKPECRYYNFKQHFKVVFTSMELKKNSWYKHFLDRCQRTLDFTGTKYRMSLQVVMKHVQYDSNTIIDKTNIPPIQLDNTVLPFAVLLLGIITSFIFLLLEIISNTTTIHKSQQPTRTYPTKLQSLVQLINGH